jgi:hypothetical protein
VTRNQEIRTVDRVVIDDLRTHPDSGVHLRTSAQALAWLRENRDAHITELWLDHDLGGEDTIRPVVLFLEEACFNDEPFDIETIYVHTASPVGADYISSSNLLKKHYNIVRARLS